MANAATVTNWFGGTGGHIIPPYYADFMRENLYPNLYMRQLGTLVTIPHGYGDKVKIPRWETPISNSNGVTTLSTAAGVTAVVERTGTTNEGVVITPAGLSADSITGTVANFLGARSYSDKLILITRANFLEGALESLVRELSFRIDRFTRKNISASGTVRGAGGSSTATRTTQGLFGKNVARIGPYFDAANTPRWDDNTLVGVTNPLAQYDIYKDPSSQGFVSTRRYNDAVDIYRGEIGEQFGVRWLMSSAIPVIRGATAAQKGLSAGATGAGAMIFAPDAFYAIELENGGVEVIHHPPGSGGSTGDPGNNVGSVAVKVWYGVTAAPQADGRLMIFSHGISLGY